MKKFYPIEKIEGNKPILFYPKDILQKSAIQTIAFGSLSVNAEAYPRQDNRKKVSISEKLWDMLHIPDIPLKLHIFVNDQVLHLGPIIGIFTAGFTAFQQNPLGSRSYLFSKIFAEAQSTGTLPLVFGIRHINWEQGLMKGYYYDGHKWLEIEIPLPNVIYNRLPNRRIENLQMMEELKTKLSNEYVIPWYNSDFFNKWDIYQKLKINNATQSYLPKTIIFDHPQTVKQMINEFSIVYIKPDRGSLGNGIYQLRKFRDYFLCLFRDEQEKNRLVKSSSIESLVKHLFPNYNHERLLIQQGIPLKEINNQKMDFRVHTNKDRNGEWRVTAIAVKQTKNNITTTHLASGGTVHTLSELFSKKAELENINRKLSDAALLFSKELESLTDWILGEIGFDMGMDKDGKIWLFEANSKPGRAIFSHSKLRKNEKIILKMVLDYGVYLTEQMIYHPESFRQKSILV